MSVLESTISMMKILPETDCPFRKLSEEEILNDLEISRRQIAAGETKEMGQAIEGIRKKYGL